MTREVSDGLTSVDMLGVVGEGGRIARGLRVSSPARKTKKEKKKKKNREKITRAHLSVTS